MVVEFLDWGSIVEQGFRSIDMNRSDFWFSGANEFNPNFSFSSSTSRSAYGRARPRLTKLRKQKSSFLGQGAADLTYNPFRNEVNEGGRGKHAGVFGWRSDMGSVAGGKQWMPADGSTSGKEYDKLRVPNFSVTSSLYRTSTAQLPKEFDKLSVREHTAAWSGGVPFTCGNSSYFEFKSSKDGDSHDTENSNGRSSAGVLPDQLNQLHSEETDRGTQEKHTAKNFVFKCSFSGLNGSTEAMLSERMEHVCIEDRVGDSNSGAARNSDHEDKENMFFRGAGVTIPTVVHTTMPSTSLENCGSRLCSSVAPSSSSSASNFRHETNFFMKTFGNRHNVNSSLNRKVKLVPKRHAGIEANLKKKRENAKHNMESRADPASREQESVFKEFSFRPESPQPYSPMDMSPNPEITVKNQHSNGPGNSEKTFTQDDKFEFSGRNTQDGNHPLDEDLVFSTKQLNIGDKVSGTSMHNTKGCAFEGVSETHPEELVSVTETESFKSATEDFNSENTTSPAVKKNSPSNSESDGSTNIYSIFNTEDTAGTNFTFAASSTSSGSASVRRFKTINRRKGFDSNRSTATSKVSNALSSGQHLEDSFQTHVKPNITVSQLKADVETNTSIKEEVNHESSGTPAATTLSQEACEKWRLRGNEAYANGDPSKAEEYYTRGVRCIPKSEKSRGCLDALMLCYSNRAATRMYLGRLREAVKDCKLAAEIDPSFLKARVRAANCYLALGEVEEASKQFKHCLHSGNGICVDRKIITEASEGLQKAQKAAEGISRSIESIQRGTCNDAEDALRSADKALTVCLYSEKLLEIKAEALFVLQKYSKVIQLCQESLDSAKRNSNTAGVNGRFENRDGALLHGKLYFMLWRCRLMLKSYFFLGKLEEALALLEKHESFRRGSDTLESLIPFVATIRELLRHKAAGNEAFKSGNYADAIEHYTAALSSNVDSRPFAAICFCNRAAAYKALGKFIDSIADCNLAIALERDYLKAISRRASLYESIRDCGQAARDTERIVSLLKEQANAGLKKSHETSTNSDISIDLRQAQMQLSRLEEQGRKDIPLNMYLILGIKSSASAAEIKKAYRQAALKHHPDKAGQLLAKGDSGRNATWKEIAEEIRRDADRLFKMIGEAYTVLSDPAQRSGYDAEEEIRNVPKKSREPFTSRTHVDAHNYPFERSRGRWNNVWRTHGRY